MSYNETKNPVNKVNTDDNAFLKNNPTMDDDYLYAASATDTTGLAPTVAHNEYEAESYQELNHYLPPVIPTAPDAIPVRNMEASPKRSNEGIHLRATDGIHAEMRTEVRPQNEFKRDK